MKIFDMTRAEIMLTDELMHKVTESHVYFYLHYTVLLKLISI